MSKVSEMGSVQGQDVILDQSITVALSRIDQAERDLRQAAHECLSKRADKAMVDPVLKAMRICAALNDIQAECS